MNKIRKVLTLSLPPDLADKAELLAKEENRTRSELFREALRQYIERRRWQQIRGWGKKSANELGIRENDIENIVNESRKG